MPPRHFVLRRNASVELGVRKKLKKIIFKSANAFGSVKRKRPIIIRKTIISKKKSMACLQWRYCRHVPTTAHHGGMAILKGPF